MILSKLELPPRDSGKSPRDTVALLMTEQTAAHATGAFVRWHLRRKFEVMDSLFRKYCPPGARVADIACGRGDGLRLVQSIDPTCELWGIDFDSAAIGEAADRLPRAKLFVGDMHDAQPLPRGHFDVVHEFGAAFMTTRWDALAQTYLSLLKPGGVLLWELPERLSLAHVAYMMNPAPRLSAAESKAHRLLRSLSPSKYTFKSESEVQEALDGSRCGHQIVERVPIWDFFCPKLFQPALDRVWRGRGDQLFEECERITRRAWSRHAGYYLVIRKSNTNDAAGVQVS